MNIASGHNLPQSERDKEFARVQDEYRLEDRRDVLLAAAAKLNKPITSDDEAALVTDQGKQLRDTISQWDGYRETEGKPHLERKRGVDSYFKSNVEPLSEALKPLRHHLARWNKRKEEEERKRREETERALRAVAEQLVQEAKDDPSLAAAITAEEQAKLAALAAGDNDFKAQVRGNYGGVASTTKRWQCTALDRAQLDLHALRYHLDEEALQKAVRRFIAAGGRTLKGATIEEVTTTQFR